MPRYRLECIREAGDQLIYQESANYGDAFTCIGIGAGLVACALVGAAVNSEDLSRRKLLATCFASGLIFLCLSVTYFITSKIILDREQQTVTVHRSLLGIGWTHHYRIDDIERVFEGELPREGRKKVLALELVTGRTKRLTLWAKNISLSSEEAHLNDFLRRFQRYNARQTGRVHKPLTDDEKWAHQKENASLDLRLHVRRTLYALSAFAGFVAALIPFLAGHALHEYWNSIGKWLVLASMVLWPLLIAEAAYTCIDWIYVRNLKKIDKEWETPET